MLLRNPSDEKYRLEIVFGYSWGSIRAPCLLLLAFRTTTPQPTPYPIMSESTAAAAGNNTTAAAPQSAEVRHLRASAAGPASRDHLCHLAARVAQWTPDLAEAYLQAASHHLVLAYAVNLSVLADILQVRWFHRTVCVCVDVSVYVYV